ncbi:hypothetical protein H5123_17345 [Shewanella sp. SR43-4]|uniref:hypothetical protein n=1 Tax=Shewanella sp. SR43-4 TaxID=2760942 RepID=UPI0015F9E1AF|nr:hypothetical protein [Shewanella sp. SR43-4]MBB1319391.1 hypothetical protein [Shewanella sp. SR43-4]
MFDLLYFCRGHNDFAWCSHLIAAEPGIGESRLHTWMMGYILGGFFITSWMSAAIFFAVY